MDLTNHDVMLVHYAISIRTESFLNGRHKKSLEETSGNIKISYVIYPE